MNLLLRPSMLVLLALAGARPARAQEPQARPEGPIVVAVDFKSLTLDRTSEHDGLIAYDPARVLASLGIRLGQPFVPLQEGIHRVWADFGIIVLNDWVKEEVPGGVHLTISVIEMAVDIAPRFVGNATFKEEKLREWAELGDRAQIYLHEKEQISQRLISGYKGQGFRWVEVVPRVSTGEAGEGTERRVIFEIYEGPKVRSTGIKVRGNDSLPDTGWAFWRGGLKSMAKLETKGRGIFRWFGKVFVDAELDADLVAMRQVYRDRGWLDAKVEVELVFNDKRNRVKIHVLVDEGPLYHVASVDIEAFERVPAGPGRTTLEPSELLFAKQELMSRLDLRPGRAFEAAALANDESTLRNFYGERGYLDSQLFRNPLQADGWEFLSPDVWHDPETHETHIIYRIHQGRPRYIREVKPDGNQHTRDRVIRREISNLPGQIANMRQLIRSRSRVEGTGYFSDQRDPQHRPPSFIFDEVAGDPELVDVTFELTEGRVVDLSLSGGIASDSGIVGLVSLAMRNFDATNLPSSLGSTFTEIYRKEAFHGNGETFSVDLSPGSQVSFWRVMYRYPDLFGSNFNRVGLTGEIVQRDRRFTSHDEDRLRASLLISKLFAQGDVSLRGGPVFQDVTIDNLTGTPLPQTLIQSEGTTSFHGLNLEFRRSKLDNRLSPRDGTFFSWSNDFFGGPLGGDQDVVRSEAKFDWYLPLGKDDDVRPGLFTALGAGVAYPYDDTSFVNYAGRFFLGGSITLRGFEFRGVGPNVGVTPIGGETMLRGSVEYRFPLYSTPIPGTSRRREMFRGHVFCDAGLLDPLTFSLNPDELRASVGFGFGLANPFPLTINFGWPIEEGPGDQLQVFSFRLSSR